MKPDGALRVFRRWRSGSRAMQRRPPARYAAAPTAPDRRNSPFEQGPWEDRRATVSHMITTLPAALRAPFSPGGGNAIDPQMANRLLGIALEAGGDYADLYFE